MKHGCPRTLRVLSTLMLSSLAMLAAGPVLAAQVETDLRFVQIAAKDKYERSRIADAGVSIEATRSDCIWGFADPVTMKELREKGFKIMGDFAPEVARGGHDNLFGFPIADEKFHDYAEMLTELQTLEKEHSDIARLQSIGKTVENRDIWALHINADSQALASSQSDKPGIIYMGQHHAREHVSREMPLFLARHILKNRRETSMGRLIDGRDIWIIPSVNPDGAEYDIASGSYRMWRKNRRNNGNGTMGVDLNRNYGFGWGTGGSSSSGSSDVYMGPAPFSEPETQSIRDFVRSQKNTRILLSFHTYSELILYPWGGKHDPIANDKDRKVFETMARQMAQWNGYTPEQASDLYIASGDTTDWAYGELGIFAFTFELSPKNQFGGGGFYPGQGILDKVFQDNLRPTMYLLENAADPYQVLSPGQRPSFLPNYVADQTHVPSSWSSLLPNLR